MLTSLPLDLTSLVVTLCNSGSEITVRWNHNERNVCLRCPSNHVFDEVTVARSINDRVVPLFCVELLSCARNRDTSFTLLFLAVHVERKSEGSFTQTLCLLLQLIQLTLRESTKLKDETASCGTLSTVDMA